MATPLSSIDDVLDGFIQTVRERADRDRERQARLQRMVEAKSEKLIPVRVLLKQMTEMGVWVTNTDRFGSVARPHAPPQALSVYENESSPSWMPGISLYMDHPARLEIAIPNDRDVQTLGSIIIRSGSHHPHADMLQGPFFDVREACKALADFIALNTERVDRPYRPDKRARGRGSRE